MVRVQNLGKLRNSAECIVLSVHRLPESLLYPGSLLAYWQCMAWTLLEAESEVTIKASSLQANYLPMRGSLVLAI